MKKFIFCLLFLCVSMFVFVSIAFSSDSHETNCISRNKENLIFLVIVYVAYCISGSNGEKGKSKKSKYNLDSVSSSVSNEDDSYDDINGYKDETSRDFCPYWNKQYCEDCPLIDSSDTLYDTYWKCRHFNCYVNPEDEPWYNFNNRKYRGF